jgi:hypothetical protein
MATEGKYGNITIERGDIPDDEPVFLLRAQDSTMCPTLSAYHSACTRAGSPQQHLDAIERAYTRVADWQEAHPDRVKTPGRTAR